MQFPHRTRRQPYNIFQQGSRLLLPFPPPPESLATHQDNTPIQSNLEEVLSCPDFGTWLLAQLTNQQASVPHSRSRGINTISRSPNTISRSQSNANTSSHMRPVAGINTISRSRGTNTISHSQSINANTSLHTRPAATTHQQPRAPHHQQQAVPQTKSASVMYNTHTSSNPPNNLSPDSDSMYLSNSSDSDISDIGAEPTSVRAQGTTVEPVVASGRHPNVGHATTRHHNVSATTHLGADQNGDVNRSPLHFSNTASHLDHGHSGPPQPHLISSTSVGARDSILPPPPYEAVAVTQPPIVVIQNGFVVRVGAIQNYHGSRDRQ
ncbi:hypothetical protein EDB19DRAFT_1911213 [Suillus lakei]|nr:hypothetical protein EDB19DRAFT_1911213 [Suillus lakei]